MILSPIGYIKFYGNARNGWYHHMISPVLQHKAMLAILGGGPTSLVTLLEFLRQIPSQKNNKKPFFIYWISRESKDKFGQG